MKNNQCIILLLSVLVLLCGYLVAKGQTSLIFDSRGYLGHVERYIGDLIVCESGGNHDAVHFNDGAPGLHSKGVLQFQRPTFLGYWRRLINHDVEDKEIDNLWTDTPSQIQLAREMLYDNPDNWRHWKICGGRANKQIGMLRDLRQEK